MLVEHTVTTHLETALRQGLARARRLARPIVVSVAEPVPAFNPIDLFERGQLAAPDRYLWAQPGAEFALVGLGLAHTIERTGHDRFQATAAEWRALLADAVIESPPSLPGVGPVFLGGFAFDAERPATELWRGYPAGRLVLHRLTFTQSHQWAWMTYNAVVGPETDPHAEAERLLALSAQVHAAASLPWRQEPAAMPVTMRELRSAEAWQADVASAAQAVRRSDLEKVVLARAVELEAPRPFNAGRALRHLAAHYDGCYIFAIAHAGQCFLGATPEQLIKLTNGELRGMSLAGSIRRGKTPEEDRQLGEALLTSEKDRSEHTVVVRGMVEALYDASVNLTVGETTLLKLSNIQHLYTPLIGELADGHTLLDLVARLHPTPAVGGRPRQEALALIRACEQLDRGWYAGPVGWVNHRGDGEFAVALRSALLADNRATLFAGCGIMADSNPEREYAESSLKLKPMLVALT